MPKGSYQTKDIRYSEASAKNTISDDKDIDNNGRMAGRNSQLGRNPAFLGGSEHSGGHQSQGVYGDNAVPTDSRGGNINRKAPAKSWR